MPPRDVALAARQIHDAVERTVFLAKACGNDVEYRRQVDILLACGLEGETVEINVAATDTRWSLIECYFDELRELAPEVQKTRLAQIEDREVREEVASLLEHSGGDSSTLQGVVGGMAAVVSQGGDSGQRIGPYELVRELGEGGMGMVFLARQSHPIRREVALKIIKPGMDTRQIVTRFESERQTLALMEHPNIARVLDAGSTPSGRPYFVMELVNGIAITQYCDSKKLTFRERLDLFIPVCQAIQHAHHKGIIHRDIKPSNILITEQDGQPVPKIIDFGIAKAVAPSLSGISQFTMLGTIVGTLEYMSPEQAAAGNQDVDTRTDIYSLGAVLYELLTGVTPLDSEGAAKATYLELLRRIREEDPSPPSSRVRTVNTLAQVCLRRRTEPGRLPRLLSGELDWIVMKALEKDRERRYETANGLLRDIQRYLEGEAVEAGPPSATYRLKKVARRYRGVLAAAAAFLVLLMTAVAVTTWLAVRANRAERAATAINAFLENDLLAQASPNRQFALGASKPDPDIKVRTVLDRAAKSVAGKFQDQPRLEASLRRTIGRTYAELGLYAAARTQLLRTAVLLQQTAGQGDRDGLSVAAMLASLDWDESKFADSETHFLPVLEAQRRYLGSSDPDTLDSMVKLSAAYASQAKYEEAEKLLNQAGDLQRRSPASPGRGVSLAMNLAAVYRAQAKYSKAETEDRKAVEEGRRELGAEHPDTLLATLMLAEDFRFEGKYPEAEQLQLRALESSRGALGPEHPFTLTAGNNLASIYFVQGKYAEAAAIYRPITEAERKLLGVDHSETLATAHNLAWSLYAQSKFAEAQALSSDLVERFQRVIGREHPRTLMAKDLLGAEYAMQGDLAKAERIHTETVAIARRTMGSGHPGTLQSMNRLATDYRMEGKLQLAEELQTEILEGLRKAVGPEHPNTMIAAGNLGLILHLQHKDRQAEILLRPALAIQTAKYPDTWQRFRSESILGASLAGQKKYAEAEPLLLSGCRGMEARQARIPSESLPNLKYARAWIDDLYRAWGKPARQP